jgi:hypothetical protein
MKAIRKIHLYLGCLFAPLMIYFALSGIWQVFRLNDLPKEESSQVRVVLHAISNPHTHSTFPGANPKTSQSPYFNWLAVLAGLGIILTSVLGIILAFRFSARPRLVLFCLLAGLGVPVFALYLGT